jgi:hypothetical protein
MKVNRRFGGTCLHLQGPKICQTRNQREAGNKQRRCSETSVDFQQTTWGYTTKDGTLCNHRCENLISYRENSVFFLDILPDLTGNCLMYLVLNIFEPTSLLEGPTLDSKVLRVPWYLQYDDFYFPFLSHIPHFEKIKVGLWDHHALCVSVYSPINFWIPETILMRLVMHIMAPEPIPRAYFTNPSHQSVCLYVY